MVAAYELNLVDQIELVRTVTTMRAPNPSLLPQNPLSKIPTLLLDDGSPLYDSLTICEYLDHLAGGGILIPPPGKTRWQALQWHSLANGLTDVLILWRNEREKEPALQYGDWLEAFRLKTRMSLDEFEGSVAAMSQAPFGLGHIALGCCLGYLDFRFGELNWRRDRDALSKWYDDFRLRRSAMATEVVDG